MMLTLATESQGGVVMTSVSVIDTCKNNPQENAILNNYTKLKKTGV